MRSRTYHRASARVPPVHTGSATRGPCRSRAPRLVRRHDQRALGRSRSAGRRKTPPSAPSRRPRRAGLPGLRPPARRPTPGILRWTCHPSGCPAEDVLVRAVLEGGAGNKSFVRYISELPDSLGRDVDVLLALSMLRRRRTIDAVGLAGVIQRSPAEAQRILQRLSEARVAEPTRRTAHHPTPTYRLRAEAVAALARALTYHRRQLDGSDEKVLEHIREYGYVTNRTVQRMFDIDVYRARNLLADMRARGLIVKIGEARGGPGVRYGPARQRS